MGVPPRSTIAASYQNSKTTIGIGAGPECSGQIQVFHDVVGLCGDFIPRHSRRYVDAGSIIRNALAEYASDVRSGTFPAPENCFKEK